MFLTGCSFGIIGVLAYQTRQIQVGQVLEEHGILIPNFYADIGNIGFCWQV
jgi:hypothetical protein